jgi:ketosteroid isomerase-like protein
MSDQGIDRVRRHYEAYNQADLDAILEGFDPEAELVAGDPEAATQFGERHTGHAEIRAFFAGFFEHLTDSRVEVVEFTSDGDRVIASVDMSGRFRDSGVAGSLPAVHAYTFRDGLILRQEYFSPSAAEPG